MIRHELAQLNVARLVAPIDSPDLADFVANLDRINSLAEASPGFVWRCEIPLGQARAVDHLFGNDVIVNMSMWTSIEALHDYVYRSAHTPVMARRREWFTRMPDAHAVLWWLPAGERPSLVDAARRLECLRRDGPTAHAFTFKRPWPAPGLEADGQVVGFDDLCPAG